MLTHKYTVPCLILTHASLSPLNDGEQITAGVKVHHQVEGGAVLEGIVEGGEPGAGCPSHDVTLLIKECSLQLHVHVVTYTNWL